MPKQVVVKIQGSTEWRCAPAEGGNWVAVCDPLQLTLQAASWGELMEDIAETLDAILKDLLETDELDSFLLDKGWQMVGTTPKEEPFRFDIPYVPAMADNHGSQGYVH